MEFIDRAGNLIFSSEGEPVIETLVDYVIKTQQTTPIQFCFDNLAFLHETFYREDSGSLSPIVIDVESYLRSNFYDEYFGKFYEACDEYRNGLFVKEIKRRDRIRYIFINGLPQLHEESDKIEMVNANFEEMNQ